MSMTNSMFLLGMAGAIGFMVGIVLGFWLGYEHWERHFNKQLMTHDN